MDGTKLEANASKYSFVWKKSTNRYQERLEEKLNAFLEEMCVRYGCSKATPKEIYDLLNSLCKDRQEVFVYGRGKRKSQLQRDIQQLLEMIERMDKYDKYQETFKGRNSFSKTDPDATFMRMKNDHMKNSQLKPGYNVQTGWREKT